MRSRLWMCTGLLFCLICICAASTATTGFTFTTIDVPGAACTQAFGINTEGKVVGVYNGSTTCGGTNHSFLLDKGAFTTIDVTFSGATTTAAEAINNRGEITGGWEGGSGSSCPPPGACGFLRDNAGNFSSFQFPGACAVNGAPGISNPDQIVGSYTFTCSGTNHGYLLSGGSFSTIDFPSSQSDEAFGINDAGDIVGVYGMSGAYVEDHGYLFSAGTFSTIDFPGATQTRAETINDPGSIAGFYIDTGGVTHGFMLDKGTFTTIDPPGATFTVVYKINNRGQMVGTYVDSTGQTHGFLATP